MVFHSCSAADLRTLVGDHLLLLETCLVIIIIVIMLIMQPLCSFSYYYLYSILLHLSCMQTIENLFIAIYIKTRFNENFIVLKHQKCNFGEWFPISRANVTITVTITRVIIGGLTNESMLNCASSLPFFSRKHSDAM